jgi:hypothetical protein
MSRSRRRLYGAVTGVLVAVALAVLAWQPWSTDKAAASIPHTACWGILDQADVAAVTGASTKVTASDVGTVTAGLSMGSGDFSDCSISDDKSTLADVQVFSGDAEISLLKSVSTPRATMLTSSVHVISYAAGVAVYFTCTDLASADGYPYAVVKVDNGRTTSSSGWQPDYATIALKIAKAVAQQAPCKNTITWPTTIPSSAASP